MRLSNGPDKCAGQLEVKSSDSWWSVSSVGWSKQNSDTVCRYLECGESKNNDRYRFVKSRLPLLQMKLDCTGSDITQCKMTREKYQRRDSVVNIICNSMGLYYILYIYILHYMHIQNYIYMHAYVMCIKLCALILFSFFLTEHELWFLHGDSPCEGRVKSENDAYLQTISDENATEVCTRNLCGSLVIQENDSYNKANSSVCPENTTSPLNCSVKNTTTSPETGFAYVRCSGTYR